MAEPILNDTKSMIEDLETLLYQKRVAEAKEAAKRVMEESHLDYGEYGISTAEEFVDLIYLKAQQKILGIKQNPSTEEEFQVNCDLGVFVDYLRQEIAATEYNRGLPIAWPVTQHQ